jgi:hypothetical protein
MDNAQIETSLRNIMQQLQGIRDELRVISKAAAVDDRGPHIREALGGIEGALQAIARMLWLDASKRDNLL